MTNLILYVCDRKACENCSPGCTHTSDINHAVYFEKMNSDKGVVFSELFEVPKKVKKSSESVEVIK